MSFSYKGRGVPMTMKKTATKKQTKPVTKKTGSMPASGKDPKGGLTAAGRAFFKKNEGANLKPGVKGAADTPQKMKRKGSFLTRHFTHPRGPMIDAKGQPTRLALSAHAWGEAVPKTEAAAAKLAAKGRKLLEQYHAAKEKTAAKKAPAKKSPAKKSIKRAKAVKDA
jgi:hypothetical protein